MKNKETKKSLPPEAEMALIKIKEEGERKRKQHNNVQKSRIYATIFFLVVSFCASNIFHQLGWSGDASNKITSIGFLGLLVVWSSEKVGKYTGRSWLLGRIGTNIDHESPGSVLRFLGWVFIFLPIIVALLSLYS